MKKHKLLIQIGNTKSVSNLTNENSPSRQLLSSHSIQPKISMFKDLDGAEISYEAAPTRTFSGLKKYPSMTTFKRKLQKMSKKLDAAQKRADLDDSGQQTGKNYFSKHAVPYFNRGSRGSRTRLEKAQPLTTGAQQETPQLTSPKQEKSQTFSKYQRPDKTTVTWYSNKQSPKETPEHMKAED